MSYILLYSEKYGYFKSMYGNYTHHTHDSHEAAKYIYLDVALQTRDYHIELFSEEVNHD